MMAPEEVDETQLADNGAGGRLGVSTPESVALVLQADSALTAEDVEALMVSFRVIYDRLRARNEEESRSEPAAPSVKETSTS
jgi:hypothetical protein